MFSRSKLLALAWLTVTSGILGTWMARHALPFRVPERIEALARQLASQGNESDRAGQRLTAVHLIDPRCSCSRRVIETLAARPEPDLRHIALLLSPLGEPERARLRAAGVELRESSPEEARKEFQLETVPWLVILSPEQTILYTGGYSNGSIRSREDVRLAELLAAARSGRALASLPTYGCVTSEALRRKLLIAP